MMGKMGAKAIKRGFVAESRSKGEENQTSGVRNDTLPFRLTSNCAWNEPSSKPPAQHEQERVGRGIEGEGL